MDSSRPVQVHLLADLLAEHDLTPQQVQEDLALALQAAGYPANALTVTAPDAVAILEWLDAGIVRSTPKQRAGLVGGFRRPGLPAPRDSSPA